MRIRTKAAAVVALLLTIASSGCGSRGGGEARDESAGEPVVSVRVRALETRRFDDVVTGSGQWRSGGESVISAPFAGLVESLELRAGDRVSAGQRVGVLVTRETWAALKGAELMQREARDGAGRDEARRALELAQRDLVRVPLTAPLDGVVLRRSAEPGAQVAEGAEIVAVAPWRTVVFEAHVPAALAARVRAGQPATVLEPGTPPRATLVQRVLPTASEADQAALVWLSPAGAGGTPGLGRFGNAEILVGAARRATGVPDSALVEDDLTGQRRVAVVGPDGRLAWTAVTLGAAVPGWHELVSPALAPGTRVVVEGQHGLPDRTRVRPSP
jgi:multidrug efflux pump subunit AcrA (membrane-fusion protein)